MGQIKKSIPTWMYPSCPLRKSQLCKPALERINILPECTVKIRTQTDTFKRAVSCFRKAKYWEKKLLKTFLWYQLKTFLWHQLTVVLMIAWLTPTRTLQSMEGWSRCSDNCQSERKWWWQSVLTIIRQTDNWTFGNLLFWGNFFILWHSLPFSLWAI